MNMNYFNYELAQYCGWDLTLEPNLQLLFIGMHLGFGLFLNIPYPAKPKPVSQGHPPVDPPPRTIRDQSKEDWAAARDGGLNDLILGHTNWL